MIFDIHDYDDFFLEQFINQTLPIYDLWTIRPLQNEVKILASGTSEDAEKFKNFFINHLDNEFPHPILIVIGNAEKNNPTIMLNTKKNYYKIKFDKYKGNDIGTPLSLPYRQEYQQGNEHMIPLSYNHPSPKQGMNGVSGISYNDIQGIVDRNVNDATRSIRAEYEEVNAKREAESIKRLAEVETKMELYKLDIRAREVEEKERRLQEELDELERMKSEGMGNVKDYTKTIASGLLEVGKTAFGIEDKKDVKSERKDSSSEDLKGGSEHNPNINDNGFSERKETEENTESQDKSNQAAFEELVSVVSNLKDDQKLVLLDILMPEESNDIKNDNSHQTEEDPENNDSSNIKSENLNNNENIQADNTNK